MRDVRLELLLLLCRSRLEILPFFATVTSNFSTLLADAVVDVSTVLRIKTVVTNDGRIAW